MAGFAGGFLQGLGGGMQRRQDRAARERAMSAVEALGQWREAPAMQAPVGGASRPIGLPAEMTGRTGDIMGLRKQRPGGTPQIAAFGGSDPGMPQQRLPQPDITPAPIGGGAFPKSLIQSESGGNWGALNNEVGAGGVRGHGGRLQFGQARLEDAARSGVIPRGMTPQEFARQPPEIQRAVENWHFSDIDREIKRRGLSNYVGQTIGGQRVTRDGMRAVAHLGGMGGLQRFIESGGRHNPADSFGTRLSDYFSAHAGDTSVAQGPPPPATDDQSASSSWAWMRQLLKEMGK